MAVRNEPPTPPDDEQVSIPLDPEEALRALLKVDPGSEPVENESPRKKPKGKTER